MSESDPSQSDMGLLTDPNPSSGAAGGIGLMLCRHHLKASWAALVVGLLFYLALAHPEYSHKTYFSENALLPGLVRGEFDEDDAVRTYLEGLRAEADKDPDAMPFPWLEAMLAQLGLEVYTHNFTLRHPLGDGSKAYTGQNVYAILRAPRSSSTEALVFSVPFRPSASLEPGTDASVAILLASAKFFSRQHYWAKDLVFLVTQHEQLGMQAWLEAYHQRSFSSPDVLDSGDLVARAGSIQAAVNLEIPGDKITHFDVKVEGLNGQLPNLDLVNLVNRLCMREGVRQSFQGVEDHARPDTWKGYRRSLTTMTHMAMRQATGVPSGNHGLFHRFGIEAVTIQGVNKKTKKNKLPEVDMYVVGRVVEGIFRSLNNLLERFHQSFFFYLLPSSSRYVSIGMYMPAFGFLGGALVISALGLWMECTTGEEKREPKPPLPVVLPSTLASTLPIILLSHVLGLVLAYLPELASFVGRWFALEAEDSVSLGLTVFTFCMVLIPKFVVTVNKSNWKVLKCLAMMELATLAFSMSLINFSLAFITTAMYVPVALTAGGSSSKVITACKMLFCLLIHPLSLVALCSSVDNFFYTESFNPMNFANATKRALMFIISDSYIYGNINFPVAAVCLVPCWYLLWCLNFAPAEDNVAAEESKSKKDQ